MKNVLLIFGIFLSTAFGSINSFASSSEDVMVTLEKTAFMVQLLELQINCDNYGNSHFQALCYRQGIKKIMQSQVGQQGVFPRCSGQNSRGLFAEGGNCNSWGCYYKGGGCNSRGCWDVGGGCNSWGCWEQGGTCNSRGCVGPASPESRNCLN